MRTVLGLKEDIRGKVELALHNDEISIERYEKLTACIDNISDEELFFVTLDNGIIAIFLDK